jgi:hypothetical protein
LDLCRGHSVLTYSGREKVLNRHKPRIPKLRVNMSHWFGESTGNLSWSFNQLVKWWLKVLQRSSTPRGLTCWWMRISSKNRRPEWCQMLTSPRLMWTHSRCAICHPNSWLSNNLCVKWTLTRVTSWLGHVSPLSSAKCLPPRSWLLDLMVKVRNFGTLKCFEWWNAWAKLDKGLDLHVPIPIFNVHSRVSANSLGVRSFGTSDVWGDRTNKLKGPKARTYLHVLQCYNKH